MCSHLQKAMLLCLLLAFKGLSESIQKEGERLWADPSMLHLARVPFVLLLPQAHIFF